MSIDVRKELEDVLGLSINKDESEEDYVKRILGKNDDLTDPEYDKLSKDTRVFCEARVKVLQDKSSTKDEITEMFKFPLPVSKGKKVVKKEKAEKKKEVKKEKIEKKFRKTKQKNKNIKIGDSKKVKSDDSKKPSTKFLLYGDWDKKVKIDRLIDKYRDKAKESTIKSWCNSWDKGKNLPSGV